MRFLELLLQLRKAVLECGPAAEHIAHFEREVVEAIERDTDYRIVLSRCRERVGSAPFRSIFPVGKRLVLFGSSARICNVSESFSKFLVKRFDFRIGLR